MDHNLEDFKDYYEWLFTCCLGEPAASLMSEVEEVIHFSESENDGDIGVSVSRLKDGRYLTIEEWQDYTGHGCQCAALSEVFNTLEDAILGLPDPGEVSKS
jgi:hypothetical protein